MKLVPPALERAFFGVMHPLILRLVRVGIRPNTLTAIGAAIVVLSGVAYGIGWIRVGGLVLLLSGVVDTLDGAVARATGAESTFGSFFDSTLDRVGDGATFMGIGAFFLTAPDVAFRVPAVLVCMVAIMSAMLVSYARAKAEGLGLECKVGIVQRAERILGLGVPSLVVGAGPRALVLEAIVAVLALLSVVTVVQRFVYVYRVAEDRDRGEPPKARPAAALSETQAKGPNS